MMLSPLIWVPIFGAALISFWPAKPESSTGQKLVWRHVALVLASGLLMWTVVLGATLKLDLAEIQVAEHITWIKTIGLSYHLGLDGLSWPLLVLNGLLTVVAVWSSDRAIVRPRFYYSLLLLLNGGVAGAFLAQDLLLFFLFYELELIPLYFLIAIWGGARRGYAAMKFLIYTAVSGILVLATFLGLVWLTNAPGFDYLPNQASVLPLATQLILLVALLIGFGIKAPFFPFHTWLPDAHVEASTPISVLLAGVLLKLGTYGLLRFGVGLFPEAWTVAAPWLASWAAISALYGALAAIAQRDMKKVVAYSSIAHMAFILLGAAAATPLSLVGTMAQMVSHGLISALLFLLVGVVYNKTGSRDVFVLRGLLNPERGLPVIGSLMTLGVMASSGIPGMAGFIAEFMIFRGSFNYFPLQTLLCMIGTGLTAVYFLLMVNRVFFGRLTEELALLPRVLWSDRIPAIALALIIVLLGLQPQWLVRWSESQTRALVPTVAALVEPVQISTEDVLPLSPVLTLEP